MCGLTPKDEFRLYALGPSTAAPAPGLPTPSSQMEEVLALLQAHKVHGAAAPQAGADARQQFMSALAHAALSQVAQQACPGCEWPANAMLLLNVGFGVPQADCSTPENGGQEHAMRSSAASHMASRARQPAVATAVLSGYSSSKESDHPGKGCHTEITVVGPDAASLPQADVDRQDGSGAEEVKEVKIDAALLAAIDAAVERKMAEVDATLTAMVDAAVETRMMAAIEAQLPACADEAVRKAFVGLLKKSRRQ